MGKEELRLKLKALRETMDASEVENSSREIADRLASAVDWPDIKLVHIYRSVPKWKEVDTRPVDKKIKALAPTAHIVYASLEKNQPLPAQQFDLIIVPVLGFDKECYRLGLGGGFYDRFLARQPRALKVGLAYQSGFIPSLPREAHDVPLDKIVTETGIMV